MSSGRAVSVPFFRGVDLTAELEQFRPKLRQLGGVFQAVSVATFFRATHLLIPFYAW
jgi:hypothetical protein